jgi:hypothetical protein
VGDIEKRRDNEEKKLERMDWCIGEYTIKKKQKEEEATETRKDKALGERARRKKKRGERRLVGPFR